MDRKGMRLSLFFSRGGVVRSSEARHSSRVTNWFLPSALAYWRKRVGNGRFLPPLIVL